MSADTIQENQSNENEVFTLSVQNQGQKTTTLELSSKQSSLPERRPVEVSHLKVLSIFSSNRPITASEMEISSTMTVSGHRPIAVSHLNISNIYTVMGGRPVASNDLGDSSILMGYLD
jgi:hypothetical protein